MYHVSLNYSTQSTEILSCEVPVFKAYCTPNLKPACFVSCLKIINIFAETIYASKELKKWHWKFSKLKKKVSQNFVLNSRTAWRTTNFIAILKFLWHCTLKMFIFWQFWDTAHNMLILQYPLKVDASWFGCYVVIIWFYAGKIRASDFYFSAWATFFVLFVGALFSVRFRKFIIAYKRSHH